MRRYVQKIVPRVVICLCGVLAQAVCDAETVPVWKGNKIGISDVPPPPFTPMTVNMGGDDARIGCWGRIYTLADTGLPVQIRSKDADLLATPVRLTTESEGRPVEWQSSGMRLVKSTQAQVLLTGTARSSIGRLDWRCTAEYDGLLRYDLQITPSPGATVDKLELVFGVKPEHAQLKWQPGQWPAERHGRLGPGEGVLVSGSPDWYTWLGDRDRGLAVFFVTEEAWDNPGRADAFSIERRPQSIEVAWRFIKGRTTLGKPWKHTFGIEATPVKQTPGGRKWVMSGNRPSQPGNFVIPWAQPKTTKYFGYPEATSSEDFRRRVAGYHQSGLLVCPYVLLNLISAGAPEFAAHPEWQGSLVSSGTGSGDVAEYGDALWAPAPTPEYIDWIVWKCEQFVRENDLDGMYHDFTMLMVLTDIPKGFGYVRDGTPMRCYPFFERRELYKRIFTMLKQHRKDAINIGHMSGDMYLPYLTFCDIIVTGEHFGGAHFNGKTHPELLPDDYIQAEIMGHNYGLTTLFLEQWGHRGPTPKQKMWAKDRFLSGLALLYDFSLWRPTAVSGSPYQAFSEFAVMEFVPFWHLGDIVRGQTDEVRCSAYRKKDGASVPASDRRRQHQRRCLNGERKRYGMIAARSSRIRRTEFSGGTPGRLQTRRMKWTEKRRERGWPVAI